MLEYFKKAKKGKEAKKVDGEEEASGDATKGQTPQEMAVQDATQQGKGTDSVDSSPRPETQSSSVSNPGPGRPVLDSADESFLQDILSRDGPDPLLPDRASTPELDWPSDDASSFRQAKSAEASDKDGETKEDDKTEPAKKSNRLSLLFSKAGRKKSKHGDSLKPEDTETETREDKEKHDLNRVLDRLNLSAKNNKVMALSDDSAEALRKFTQIFKDLANGVPTAYDDLVNLIKDRDGAITKAFEKLPSGLQKLVMQLPEKVTGSIAPQVLAAAAKSQGVEATAAVDMLSPQALFKVLTQPGALVGMLRAIVTALQQRWPAFIGVNVLWSVALCLLMFVLWYCYKRGRETRLDQEESDVKTAAAEGSSDPRERLSEPAPTDPYPEGGPSAEPSAAEAREALSNYTRPS